MAKCQGQDCWADKKALWRIDLRMWLCSFHYRKLTKETMGDKYA